MLEGVHTHLVPADPLGIAATVAALWFLLITVSNTLFLRRTRRVTPVTRGLKVSVILPVRNEENNIVDCLSGLSNQSYTDFEIIVVDDNSDDNTAALVTDFMSRDSRVKLTRSGPVPASWNGKQFACNKGVSEARGDLLFFTDADVRHRPQSIARAVAQLNKAGAHLLSGYVHQEIKSLGELLIVPMTYIMTTLLLPLRLLTTGWFPTWGFAIGQYILIHRDALEEVGGYELIKDSLVEDMALSRAVRASGRPTVFVDAQDSASCRMYNGYWDAFRGFAKSIFGAVGGRAIVMIGLILAISGLIIAPFHAWLRDMLAGGLSHYPSAVPVLLFLLVWGITLLDRGLPAYQALLYPVAFANLVAVGVVSTLRTGFGRGIEWKGRLVRVGRGDLPDPEILNAVVLYRLLSLLVYTIVLSAVVVYNKVIFGLRVNGRHHLRGIDGGFFLISNHTLYLDPGIIAHAIFPRRAYFSALAETFERPFIGGFIRLLGAFPLPHGPRLHRIIGAIDWALRRGRCVHFFPEGELHHRNQVPAEFHEGVFYLADRFDVPVVPVTLIIGERRLFGMNLPRSLVRVTVDIGEPIRSEVADLHDSRHNRGAAGRREHARTMAELARARMTESIQQAAARLSRR